MKTKRERDELHKSGRVRPQDYQMFTWAIKSPVEDVSAVDDQLQNTPKGQN